MKIKLAFSRQKAEEIKKCYAHQLVKDSAVKSIEHKGKQPLIFAVAQKIYHRILEVKGRHGIDYMTAELRVK